MELYEHQQKAVEQMHNGCILRGGVGSGKSLTSIYYFYTKECNGKFRELPQTPKDLYIITTARKRDSLDWDSEFSLFALAKDPEASVGGIRVTVDSWNNIKKYTKVKDAFFIFDEQRLVGSGAWVKSFIKIAKSNNWILLTATPGDTWLDYGPVFVANGFYENISEFKRNHVVYNPYVTFPSVDRYVGIAKLVRHRNAIMVSMEDRRHTVRHIRNVHVEYDKEEFKKVYKDRWNVFENKPIKDAPQYAAVMRKLVNLHPSRIDAVVTTFKMHERLIVFYNFDYELEKLRELGDILNVEVVEWNGHKHEPVPEGEKWVYLVQYMAGAEAWNCVKTNATLFYSLNYSWRLMEQAKGRIDRINTKYTDLYYYVLRSNSVIDGAISTALSNKKNFNERMLKF